MEKELTDKEITLLRHLRANSRKSLVQISNETEIPISTLFNCHAKLQKGIILKHVSIPNFTKLGYSLRMHFIVTIAQKKELRDYLADHPHVNNLSTVLEGFHFECLFSNMNELAKFKELLKEFEFKEYHEATIVEELKKEEFRVE